jgi:hypothetical protein
MMASGCGQVQEASFKDGGSGDVVRSIAGTRQPNIAVKVAV